MKKLNEILAAAEVSATNIKARHWMVAGPHFYSIHLMLDDVYKTLQKGIDAVAERLRVLATHLSKRGHSSPKHRRLNLVSRSITRQPT